MNPDLETRVANHPFLTGLTAQQLAILRDCSAAREFAADELIFRAGDPARGFYLLESGRVAVEGEAEGGKTACIDIVAPGEPLGWSWIFEPFICQYSARALDPSTALFIDAARLSQHRGADLTLGHELFRRMSQVMVRRLTAARARLVEAAAATG